MTKSKRYIKSCKKKVYAAFITTSRNFLDLQIYLPFALPWSGVSFYLTYIYYTTYRTFPQKRLIYLSAVFREAVPLSTKNTTDDVSCYQFSALAIKAARTTKQIGRVNFDKLSAEARKIT